MTIIRNQPVSIFLTTDHTFTVWTPCQWTSYLMTFMTEKTAETGNSHRRLGPSDRDNRTAAAYKLRQDKASIFMIYLFANR